ncbi:MAG TPA: lytic murein transglycosylase B [Gammaproteobacteria bacterium]|nr:lytic murein transglycosylase B [Gammaproteobacteria bacterium]
MKKSFFHLLTTFFPAAVLATASSSVAAKELSDNPALHTFINKMVEQHQFNGDRLTRLFKKTRLQPDIIAAISKPAEAKPWYQYRPIFLTDKRVKGGAEFWDKHAETLARAEQEYGVPPEIIIAIIGVETRYGGYTGKHRVIDALTTLAFDYPPRSKFFTSELEQYLLMTREEQIDPLSLKGSYAGAMGIPQFISSSYRNYAVDFDHDGHRNLWDNPVDAIGSVANYFKRHGWKPGEPITVQAHVSGNRYPELVKKGIKPQLPLAEFSAYGVQIPEQLDDTQPASLLELETEGIPEFWIGLHNFYVITRYNHSPLYAMAVYQLSNEIRRQWEHK